MNQQLRLGGHNRDLHHALDNTRYGYLKKTLGLLLFATLAGCNASMPLSVSRLNPNDEVNWLSKREPVHIEVVSRSGIGSMVLNTESEWPTELFVSLPLAALEGFSIRADTQAYRLEVSSDNGVLLEPNMKNPLSLVRVGDQGTESPYTVRIDLATLNTTQSEILVSWVDYYR